MRRAAAAIAAGAVYALLSFRAIDRPGIQYDEAVFVNAALGAPYADGFVVRWGRVPVMVDEYNGPLKAYLFKPVFAWFGVSAASIRVPAVLLGCLTLLLTWRWVRRLFDDEVATASVLLLAFD